MSPCGHLSRRCLAYSSSASQAGQCTSPLVSCTPRQYRRTMRVTVSISFFLFKLKVPFGFAFWLACSDFLVESKADLLCAVCLRFSHTSNPVITAPLSAQVPAVVVRATNMCFLQNVRASAFQGRPSCRFAGPLFQSRMQNSLLQLPPPAQYRPAFPD